MCVNQTRRPIWLARIGRVDLDWMDQVWHSRQGRLEAGGQRDQGTNRGSETSLL